MSSRSVMGNRISCHSCREDGRDPAAKNAFHAYVPCDDAASPPPIEARDDGDDLRGNIKSMRVPDSPRHPPSGEARRRSHRRQQRRIFADAVDADPFNAPESMPRRSSGSGAGRVRRSLRGGACRVPDLWDSPHVPAVVSFPTVSFSEDEDGDGVSVCTIDRVLLADEREVEPTPEDLSALRRMVKEFWNRPLKGDPSPPLCVPVSSVEAKVCDSAVCVPIEDDRSTSHRGRELQGRSALDAFDPRGSGVVTLTEDDIADLSLPFEGYRRHAVATPVEDGPKGPAPPFAGYHRRRSSESYEPPLLRRSHSHGCAALTPVGDLQYCCSDLSDPNLRLEGYRRRHSGESPDDVADFPCGTEARAGIQAMHEGMYIFHRQSEMERDRRKSEVYPRPRRPTAEMLLFVPPLP